MKTIDLGKSGLSAPEIALGCMRINKIEFSEAQKTVSECIDLGINFFDHADIYGKGECEKIFGNILKKGGIQRNKVIIQTKCGIREGFFDFSMEHIVKSVNESLERLQTDYIDVLLLHRPDTLMEPEEVAQAFDILHKEGKVRFFGVSNQNSGQLALLQKHTDFKLIVNQLQFGIKHTGLIDSGLNVNMQNGAAVSRDNGTLEYCRLNDITIQAWSPFQYGFFEGTFLGNVKFEKLNKVIDRLSKKYDASPNAVAAAWILRHPAKIQVIIGTMNRERISGIAQASEIYLTREEWYEIYRAAGNVLP